MQDQPEEVKLPSACDVSKAGRSYPVPEDNGDPGSVDPAAPELIHKGKVPAEQAPPVGLPAHHSQNISLALPGPHMSTLRRVIPILQTLDRGQEKGSGLEPLTPEWFCRVVSQGRVIIVW